MLRQNSSSIDPNENKHSLPIEVSQSGSGSLEGSLDLQRELNHLEEMILASPRIPLTGRTLVDEEQLLDKLDLVRIKLPTAFGQAQEVVRQKEEIILQAEQYAEEIIEAAKARAAQLLNELSIMRQAEREASLIRQQVQQEFDAAKAEIEMMHRKAQQDLEEMQQRAICEAEEIQQGADEYADSVLKNIEQQLNDMLRITRNGRIQLQPDTPPNQNPPSSLK